MFTVDDVRIGSFVNAKIDGNEKKFCEVVQIEEDTERFTGRHFKVKYSWDVGTGAKFPIESWIKEDQVI